jgi:hypothetical protein
MLLTHNETGTRAHQRTKNAMKGRTAALFTQIRKFNKYCSDLQEKKNPTWMVPLPKPLPLDITKMREDPEFYQDVWISVDEALTRPGPDWLTREDVRMGIRLLHKIDRCAEERKRLGREADNMCKWFGNELKTIEMAIVLSTGTQSFKYYPTSNNSV